MSERRRSKPSASTWLILLLVMLIAVILTFTITIYNKSNTQKTEINMLKKQIEDNKLPEGTDAMTYQKLYPDMHAKLSGEWRRSSKTVYLTFDDGPSKVTKEVLKVLSEEGVKATFFVIGEGSDHNLMKNIVDAGHEIAVHTYSHDYKKIYDSVDNYIEDFYKIFTLIKEKTGVSPSIFRYPGGSNNVYNVLNQSATTAEMLRRGFVPFDWNVDSGDANAVNVPVTQIVNNSLKGIGTDRVIILMHDAAAKSTTAKALPKIIKKYKEAGYNFDILTNEDAPILFSTPDGERYE